MSLVQENPRVLSGSSKGEIDFSAVNPVITIRPHHVSLYDVYYALKKQWSVASIVDNTLWGMLWEETDSGDPSGYYSDLLGVKHQGLLQFKKGLENFFSKLRNLQDNDFAHLDLKADGICEACAVGKHCSGTNYRSMHPPRSTLEKESGHLNKIRQKLESGGFIMGVDFAYKETTHVLHDLGGSALNDSSEDTPSIVIFNSMIVRVGALRSIIN